MKLLIKSNYKKYISIIIAVLSVFVIVGITWLFYDFHNVPACKSVIKIIRPINGEKEESLLLLSVVPSGFRETTFVINGHASAGNGGYTISRVIEADYTYKSGYYHFTVKDVKKQPADNIEQDEVSKTIPILNSKYFLLKIERLSNNSFVFTGNRAPAFICTKTTR
ncbi:hypothetical protein ACUTSW_22385 [Serratia sp. TSA_198.1]|jgi:hypothetical protein|uniref:hypothetical protein n=1 Tax=Serratia sp. TSA_198.1 TaxID=3415664 RepID=UPI00404655A3